MSKKIIQSIILCSSLFFISGCGQNRLVSTDAVGGAIVEPQTEIVVEEGEVTDQQLKLFFSKFLTVDHESMLVLNQKPKEVNDEYWRVYRAYEEKTNEILGDYLASSAKSKLKQQYLHDDFHFPRFIELNDYMVTGISNVSDAIITSKQIKKDSIVYEVQVIGIAEVIDLAWANLKYIWDDEKGYYVQNVFLETGVDIEDEPGLDKIKLAMNYLVEVPNGETFTVSSVREKTGLYLSIDEQANIKNNHFVTRLSFLNAVIAKEEAVIHTFIDRFLNEDYNFYNYYRKAHETDYDTFKIVLETDLGFANVVELDAASYKQQFEPSIIPLKDDMESLYFDVIEDVVITPHVSSSAKLSTYQVEINAEVTLINGQVVPYQYTYLFILDKDPRISSVRLMTQQEIDPNIIVNTGSNSDVNEEVEVDVDAGAEE